MKRHILILALTITTAPVVADDAHSLADAQLKMIKQCASWSNKAEYEMIAYQMGMTLEDALANQQKFYGDRAALLAEANDLVMDIHSTRRYNDEKSRENASVGYRDYVHHRCLIEIRGRLNRLRAEYGTK